MKSNLLLVFLLCTSAQLVQAQTVEFMDDFESGTGNWVLEGTWGTTTSQSNSPSTSLTDSPAGLYGQNLNISATLANGIDLSGALDADLSFFAIYDIEGGNFDYVYVDASADGGATWTTIATFLGPNNLDPWVEWNFSLGGFVGSSDVKIRFRLFTDGGLELDGMYIDDVKITSSNEDNASPLILHEGPKLYESQLGDVTLTAEVIDISGIATANLVYQVNSGAFNPVAGTNTGGDTYEFVIPAQAAGAQVDYFFQAQDASPNANSTVSESRAYIAGNHIFYDNGVTAFVNSFGPAAASGLTGNAVRISLGSTPVDVKYALIRNYTDTNRPNNDFEFHIWSDNNGFPGDDLITPFMVTPEANLLFTSPMTRIDLSAFSAELSGLTGDVFIGYTVPEGETWLTQTTTDAPMGTTGQAGRTYVFDGANWIWNFGDDYHFRLVTDTAEDVLTCDDVSSGSATTNLFTCFNETLVFSVSDVVIPETPASGFYWAISQADITGSSDPASEPSFVGGTGWQPMVFEGNLVNDGTVFPAGTYFITPVAFGDAVGNSSSQFFDNGSGNPITDFSNACLSVGQSQIVILADDVNDLTASSSSVPSSGNDGEAGVTVSGGTGDYTYNWDNGGITATITGLTPGTYTVTISDLSGCVDDIVVSVVVEMGVSVEDIQFANSLKIFPNPANEVTRVYFDFESSTDLNIRLQNTLGQTLQERQINNALNGSVQLKVSDLATGVYLLHITDGNRKMTKRLFVN